MSDQGQLHAARRTFGKTPEQLMHDLDMTDGAVRLYAHMHWRYGSNKQNWEGQRSMAEMLGVTESTISSRIKELEAADWIIIVQRDFNPTTGAFQTPFYHVFEQQRDCREFRKAFKAASGEALREKPAQTRKRKSRKGVGGNPRLHRLNLSSDGDRSNSSSDGQPNLSSDGRPNSSSDNPDAFDPDSVDLENTNTSATCVAGLGQLIPILACYHPITASPSEELPFVGSESITSSSAPPPLQTPPLVFDKNSVYDVVCFCCFGLRNVWYLRKEAEETPQGKALKKARVGARAGKIAAFLKGYYPNLPEPAIVAKIRSFYTDWAGRKSYSIPRDDAKFGGEWLEWEQETTPARSAAPDPSLPAPSWNDWKET